jgi:ubiquinone/menaquinone biosynthesis C-methylase UbiE/broad specificity phosphatase PhoE
MTPTTVAAETRLLLVSHAEGMVNRYQNLPGYESSDDNGGLTALGWEQANQLASWLKSHERVDVLLCSPQLRSRLTAQRVGQVLALSAQLRQDLPKLASERLMPPGSFAEMPRSLLELHLSSPPEGELYRQFSRSVVAAVDQIVREHWGKTILLVMSGVAVAATIRHFFGAQLLPISVSYTGISEIAYQAGNWSLLYLNRREHLPTPLSPVLIANEAAAGGESPAPEDLALIGSVYNRLAKLMMGQSENDRNPVEKALADKVQADRLQHQRHFLKFAHLAVGSSVLELGSGNGALSLSLAEDGAAEVIGVDISTGMLEAAEYLRLSRGAPAAAAVSFRLAAAQALPFAPARFDVVVCHMLLHYSQRPAAILQEAARVLKPGGVFVLAELLAADDPVKRATQNAIEERRNPSHKQVRNSDMLRKLVSGAGLTIEVEKIASFDIELMEWVAEYQVDSASRDAVRNMVEAGVETNATGLNVRRQGEKTLIEQRLLYVRALKK